MPKLREPVNALSHFAGAAAAAIGLMALLSASQHNLTWTISLAVYGFSLVFLFLASAVYHAAHVSPKWMEILRKVDHAAIYVLIAGTYTPFCVIAFSGFWQWGMLALIWGLAVIGIVVKVFVINAPRWVTAGVYVIMGWLSVIAFGEMITALPRETIGWLFAGGVVYTLGAVIYITRKLDFLPGKLGFHEIWHFFVLLGAGLHYGAVVSFV